MSRWLRLLMIGCLMLSISLVATGCKKESATQTNPAVEEEAPVEQGAEEW